MVEDIKEFDKLIKEKNISDVDTMMEESKKVVDKSKLGERYKEVVIMRGKIIEASIILEMAFNEVITKTGGEDLIINPEKKEFHLISGAKKENELGGLGFKDKIKILKSILLKAGEEPPDAPESPLLADLEKIAIIRDIFAHAPVSWFSKELEFDDNPYYKHFFKLNLKWKSIPTAFNEFMSLQKEILELIPAYIKLVLLKRELFSRMLLGKSFNDILKEAKENNKPEGKISPQ